MRILKEKKIDEVPVIDKKKRPIGLLDVQDLLKAGLV
jgi:CBS domain-containing protein